MMSRHFRLSSEHTGAIAKKLPNTKNQLSVTGSFFNQFVTDIYIYIYIYKYKRASFACAARLADTLCPPEAPFGRLGSHWLIIRKIKSLNTSVLLLESKSREKSTKLSIFKILDE